jgi:hypothetical protein
MPAIACADTSSGTADHIVLRRTRPLENNVYTNMYLN